MPDGRLPTGGSSPRVLDMAGGGPGTGVRPWLAVVAAGVITRLALALVSIGSNDAAAWHRFGEEVSRFGLLRTYQIDPDFNHPPLPAYWAAAAVRIVGPGDNLGDIWIFSIVFKLPAILADCAGIYLLWWIWRRRIEPAGAWVVAALFALSLDAILVSGYHCNTDPVFVSLCLLAVYLMEDRGRPFWGGFALGAAINVKIIPVLLVLPLLLSCRRWRDLAWFIAGMAPWVLPFLPPLLLAHKGFVDNALSYNSVLDRWGVNFFVLFGRPAFDPSAAGGRFALWYYWHARYLIVALIGLWAVVARLSGRWGRYELAAVTFAIFLVLTPGFGVQYTVLVGLLLFAVRVDVATVYGLVAGLFLAAVYAAFRIGPVPLYSEWRSVIPPVPAFLGLMTWLLLVYFLIAILMRPVGPAAEAADMRPTSADAP